MRWLLAEVGGIHFVIGLIQFVFADLLAVFVENLAELGVGADGLRVLVVELGDEPCSLL